MENIQPLSAGSTRSYSRLELRQSFIENLVFAKKDYYAGRTEIRNKRKQ